MLDLFGASGQMSKCWRKAGWEAFAYDIKTNSEHDLTSANGFWELCKAGKKLMTKGLIFGGPPCSLYVWISKSVHNRREDNKYIGETRNLKVRMSNRIVANMCVFLEELSEVKAGPSSLCFRSLDTMPSVLRRAPQSMWVAELYLEILWYPLSKIMPFLWVWCFTCRIQLYLVQPPKRPLICSLFGRTASTLSRSSRAAHACSR